MHPISKRFSSKLSLAVAAVTAALAGERAMAQYAVTNAFSVSATSPYVASDAVSGTNVNYSSISIANPTNPGLPNGSYGPLFGTLAGTDSSNSGVGVTTAFLYNSSGLTLIGAYTETSTGYHFAGVTQSNQFGQVIGSQTRDDVNSSSSGVTGQEAWLYTPGQGSVFMGLFGANNTYLATTNSSFGTTATYSRQTISQLSSTGYVGGSATRYEGSGGGVPNQSLGNSAWVFDPSTPNSNTGTTIEVGLMGDGNSALYTYGNALGNGTVTTPYYSNSVTVVSANGEVAGTSSAYTGVALSSGSPQSLGTDAWAQAAGASSATRLGGFTFTSSSIAGYTATSITASHNSSSYTQTIPSPTITPASGTFTTTFAYGYIPTSGTYPLGSTYATQVDRSSNVTAVNPSGLLGVTSTYYINNTTSSGQDAFIYNPSASTPYTQVGLTTDAWPVGSATPGVDSFVSPTGARSSTVKFINASGQSAGTSAVYIPGYTGASFGQAAWYASASGATTQIGLYNTADGYHVNSFNGSNSQYSQYQYSESITNMNDLGMVAGYASRYSSVTGNTNGQDAWVYDPRVGPNGTTFIVDPAAEATNPNTAPLEATQIYYLSPSGVALGEITYGTAYPYSENAFIWTESGGFTTLDATIAGGLPASGYQNIINAYYSDSPGNTILATGSFTNSATTNGLATLTGTVPEPSSLSLLGLGAAALLRRRRRLA